MQDFALTSNPGEQLGIALLVMMIVFIVHSMKGQKAKSVLIRDLRNGEITPADYEMSVSKIDSGLCRRALVYATVATVATIMTLFGNGIIFLF